MDENKGQVETESNEKPILKIAVDRISSKKLVVDPLQAGFTFVIDGFVYQVYEVRARGRKFIKLVGKVRA